MPPHSRQAAGIDPGAVVLRDPPARSWLLAFFVRRLPALASRDDHPGTQRRDRKTKTPEREDHLRDRIGKRRPVDLGDHAQNKEDRAEPGQKQDDADNDHRDLTAGERADRRDWRRRWIAHASASAFIAARILSIAPLR